MENYNKVLLIFSLLLLAVGVCTFFVENYFPEFFVFGEIEIVVLVSFSVSVFLFVMWIFLEVTTEKPKNQL